MNALQIFTWAASNIDQASELIAEVEDVPAPTFPNFGAFVDAAYKPVKRLATVADTFPAEAMKALPAEDYASRLETAKKAIGDGSFRQKLEKIIPIALQLWEMWSKFKPV